MSVLDWVPGDQFGLLIPAHPEAFRTGGADFLTQAFRAASALGDDNKVARITRFEDCPGGSTGRKLFLSVAYKTPEPDLPTELFVKFSRDFDNEIRDRAKNQLEAEVRLAMLSRLPGFPIAVPTCMFADYQHETGTGLLITQQIGFGENGVEPLYEKCRDYEMPSPLEHYEVLVKTLARLTGAHKAGRLSADVGAYFPFDAEAAAQSDQIRFDAEKIQIRISRFQTFAARYPRLVPESIRAPSFIARLSREAPLILANEAAIKRALHAQPDFIALCHWNANVDNAWFWRDEHGALQCGLLDWGRVGQMSIALALWGGLSAAEKSLWDEHFDHLIDVFIAAFRESGGPGLNAVELKRHILFFVVTMGLAWLMDAPVRIETQIPNLSEIDGRFDPRFSDAENARVQLQMLINFLNFWERADVPAELEALLSA